MNGTKYFIDTNAIIALLNGNKTIENAVQQANWLGISVVTIIEFLSFKNLTANDKQVLFRFLQRVSIVNLSYPGNLDLINQSSLLRILHKLKLPDAVIASSSIINKAILIANDKKIFKVPNLQILSF